MTQFTFYEDIPDAPNNPSDDQPLMKINNQSTSGIIAVDHVGFGVDGGGQHTAITFNQDASYVPSSPVTPPKLFTSTSTPGSLAQLFYYTGTASQGRNQYYVTGTSSVSTFLFGGITIRTGILTQTATTTVYTYTGINGNLSAFPNRTVSVQLTPANLSAQQSLYRVDSISASGFTVVTNVAGINGQYYYLAIGS